MTFDLSKCTPFNLTRAIAGDLVITRDGRKVPWMAYCPLAQYGSKVYAHIEGNQIAMSYCENGALCAGEISDDDLFMAPKVKEVWVRVYINSYGVSIPLTAYQQDDPILSKNLRWIGPAVKAGEYCE